MDSSVPRGAACAACVFVRPVGLAPHFSALEAVAANVGDCRVALLVDGDLHALSVKHTPGAAPAELERVRNAGCAVGRAVDKKGNHHGPLRVYPGGLAVTRALGGSAYAKAVTPIPAVRSVTLPPHCWSRLIVASNGVWSALPQRAVERVLASHGEPAAAARALVAAARMRRPGMDDTTVVVVDIPPMDWNEAGVTGGERTPGMASHSRSRSHLPTKPWPLEAVRPVEHPIGLRAAQDDEASETGREGGGSGLTRTVSDLTMTGEHVRASFASEARGLSGLTVLDEMPSRKVGPPGRLEESYKLGKVLGHGKYGHVYAATTRDAPHREVAVKAVDLRSEVLRRRVCEELDCLVQVSGRHPRVPRVEATFEQCFSGDGVVHVCIVTDRYRGGTLLDYLGSLETLDDTIVATLMGQLLSALAFLHAQHPPIAHRDIKPTNIMIRDGAAEDPQLVLLDFGLATCVGTASHGGRSLNAMAGTRFFQAPEVVAREGYGVSADIWSCGVLLWALLAGMPAPGAPVREAFEIIQRGELPPSTPTNLSDDLRDLLSQMLQPDPSKRVTARNALNHPWLARTREHAHSYAGGKSARPVSPSDLSVVSCESDADLSRRSSNGDFSEGSMHGIQAMQSAAAFEAEALAALRDHLNAHETRTVLRELNLGADMHLGLTEGTTLASDLEDALLEVGCSEAHAAITLLCFRYGNPNMLALSSAKLVAMLGVHAMYATTSSARGEATGDSPPLFGGGRERWRHSSASSAGSSQSSGRAYASTGTYGGAARSFLAGGMAGAAA
uniref:Protein kinase domain-containing protein n=1 Tax=Prasinoderma coloniale TaxID=156133 RepID=A0A7R9TE50_9VIRI